MRADFGFLQPEVLRAEEIAELTGGEGGTGEEET